MTGRPPEPIIRVSWVSPATGEPRLQDMTEEQAREWWAMASYPVQCTATFKGIPG